MANTKITADNLAANAVTSASIADNSIGITQLNVSDGTNGQVLTTNGSGTLSFSTISGYTDSDVETYLNTSAIYTDPTNDRLGIGTSSPMVTLNVHNPTNPRIALTNSITGQTFPSGLELLLADSDAYIAQRENANLIFSTNNTERLRIDNSGNVGIGTSTFSATYDKLAVAGGIHIQDDNSAKLEIGRYSSGASNSYIKLGANSNALNITNNTDSADIFTILNSGNVGIGTTNPAGNLEVKSTSEAVAYVTGNGSSLRLLAYDASPGCWIQAGTSTASSQVPLYISGMNGTNITATFDTANQRVGIGTTSPIAGAALDVQPYLRAGNLYVGLDNGSRIEGGNGQIYPGVMSFIAGAANMDINHYVVVTGIGINLSAKLDSPTGDWYTNDGSVSSLSDERVKTDITDLSDGLEIVKQLRPVTFKYNDNSEDEDGRKRMGAASDKVRYGFIAQEVEEVAPQYVETGIGYINNEEVDDFKSMSTTRMIPMLFKAIQEQQTIIDDLKARIETLENA